MKILAHDIHFGIQDDTAMVAFRSEDEQHYLMLTRSLNPTSQDRKLGQDKIHVELDDQASSTYGGIEQARLYLAKLDLVFDAHGAESLGTRTLTVSIDLIQERFAQLRQVIATLFEGHRNFGMIA